MKIEISITGRILEELERERRNFPMWDDAAIIEFMLIRGIVDKTSRKKEVLTA